MHRLGDDKHERHRRDSIAKAFPVVVEFVGSVAVSAEAPLGLKPPGTVVALRGAEAPLFHVAISYLGFSCCCS